MNKNICIVHYNTPALTACLIKSINKFTPGTNIFVFDNSDKKPFINEFENVTVFDNTSGQIINFTEWLNKYPGRLKSNGKVNNYGSAKHCISVQKCIELIDKNFVLIDSDVLLRKDISGIWDGNYYWVGGTERWSQSLLRKRVCPFLLYLNVEKMKQNGITFFDDKHMFGLNNGPRCEEYDTGCWLYEKTLNKGRIIKYNDYIVHFRAGSWLHDARTKHHYKQMEPKKWLSNFKKYWIKDGEKLDKNWYEKYEVVQQQEKPPKKIMNKIEFKDVFDHIYCLHYLPTENRLPKIKEELKRVGIDENADYFSWVYDYPSPVNDMIYNDKRLNMSVTLRSSGRDYIKRVSMKHYEIIKEAYSLGYKKILILENDIRFHRDLDYINKMLLNIPDTDIVMFDKMTCSAPMDATKYKQYIKTLPEGSLYGSMNDSGVFFIFCSCYALNRTGMKQIIELQEAGLLPPDTPLNDKSLTGSFAIVNIAIQDPKLKTRKSEAYTKIGLDTVVYGSVTDNEAVPKSNDKPVTPEKTKPATKQGGPKKIVFRIPPKPQMKRRIEPNISKNRIQEKRTEKRTKPTVTRTIPLKKITRSRVIPGKAASFNKLYDV